MRRNNRGDTIVEVLICIAIVSFVLGGAYGSARNSQIAGIRARERDEATKLLEQQAEFLRAASALPGATTPFTVVGSFCLTSATTIDTSGPCTFGSDSRYKVDTTRSATDVFNIVITWERAGGGAQEELSSYYRVHEGTP